MKWFRFFRQKPKRKQLTLGELMEIPGVDDATVNAFFAGTHDKARRMPLLIAAYVASQYQDRLTKPGRMDALEMAETRGALKSIRLFATYYHNGIEEWLKKGGGARDVKA